MRVGLGYDIHRLVKGKKLFLGGIEIPYEKGPLAHSDGDVVLHAVCDALLGAMGKADIGEYFPDTDVRYKNIPSSKILAKIFTFAKAKKLRIENLDITLVAKNPKISPYRVRMRRNIAKTLETAAANVNIKATTNEGVGLIGEGQAIAAFAVVALEER